MIVVCGRSGSGKDTVINILAKYGYEPIATHTTRQMRPGEVNGREHTFISEEEFERMLNNGEFFEHTELVAGRYGTAKKDIKANSVVTWDVNPIQRARDGGSINPFFVLGVDADESVCRERMIKRGDLPDMIEGKINEDRKMFDVLPMLVDVILVNNHKTISELEDVVLAMIIPMLPSEQNQYSNEYIRIRHRAEREWPDWKVTAYNSDFATSVHSKKIKPITPF